MCVYGRYAPANAQDRSTLQRYCVALYVKKKNALYLNFNVFSTKVLIVDTIFTSPNGDGTAILRGHPSHAKV